MQERSRLKTPGGDRSTQDDGSRQLPDRLRRLVRAEEQRDVFVYLARRLAGATVADAVMSAAQEASEQLLAWDFFYLAHRLPGSDQFRLAGVVDTIDGKKMSFPAEHDVEADFSPAVRNVLGGIPLLINRQEGETTPSLEPLGSKRLSASLLYVPVRCEGRVIGLLSAHSYTPNRYSQSDLRLLQDIADAVAPAMERIRAEESLRSSQQLLRLERDLAISLSGARGVGETVDRLLETSLQIDGIDCGGAYFVDPITHDHSLVCYRNLSACFADRVKHVSHDSRPATLACTGRAVYLATPELHAVDAACRDEGLQSLAVVPVAYEGSLIAVLNLASRRFNEIPHHSRHAIEAIAAQMGAALVRIRAEQALREARDQLEQRVQDRTAELLDANVRLQAEILERRRAEQALRESEERYRAIVQDQTELICRFASDGEILFVNDACCRCFGLSPEQIVGKPFLPLVVEEDRASVESQIASLSPAKPMVTVEERVCIPDGLVRWYQWTNRGFFDDRGALREVLAVGRDITDLKQAQEALLIKERKLRLLGVEANRRLEEERARVSRELHDELGQILTALNLNLSWLGRRIGDVDSDIVERIDESAQYVSRMLASVRSLSRSLRPVSLGHEGLAEAVRSHAGEFEQYAGIPCEVEVVPPDLEVGEPLATTAFRIVQEALTNVARHSRATRCRVGIEAVADLIILKIRDNGIGLHPEGQTSGFSLGIPGMKERAEIIGGSVVVTDNPGGGVCVTAHLPRRDQEPPLADS